VESPSSGGFLVYELVIPGGIPILQWIPRLWGGDSRQIPHLSHVAPVLAHRVPNFLRMIAIPGFITPVYGASFGTLRSKSPPDGNNSQDSLLGRIFTA
jgi:hypothetical protein